VLQMTTDASEQNYYWRASNNVTNAPKSQQRVL